MCTVPSFWYSRADTANNKLKTNKELKKVYNPSSSLKNIEKNVHDLFPYKNHNSGSEH